jgi:4-hydroxybenzoate polyprenyltransferase
VGSQAGGSAPGGSQAGSPQVRDTLVGIARLVHPFPSILTAVLTVALALMAGGDSSTVARLGLGMLAIQFAIGAFNDLADADRDAGVKRSKPIPGGQVSPASARVVGVVAVATGLALAASVNRGALVLAALGAGVGIVYDLRLKGTPLSWLPFAVGIPLLPVFAWLGASGVLPAAILVATVVAFPAGAALALANELPDIERDEQAGLSTLSQLLGRRSAWAIGATLHAVVGLSAALGFQALDGRADLWPALLAALGLLGVGVLLGAGTSVARRQRAWEVQAIAIGVLAAVWLAAVPRQP